MYSEEQVIGRVSAVEVVRLGGSERVLDRLAGVLLIEAARVVGGEQVGHERRRHLTRLDSSPVHMTKERVRLQACTCKCRCSTIDTSVPLVSAQRTADKGGSSMISISVSFLACFRSYDSSFFKSFVLN